MPFELTSLVDSPECLGKITPWFLTAWMCMSATCNFAYRSMCQIAVWVSRRLNLRELRAVLNRAIYSFWRMGRFSVLGGICTHLEDLLTSQYQSIWLDPTCYLQATSSFQLGEPFGSWFHEWENFTRDQSWPGQLFRPSFRSHQQALGNLTSEWTLVVSKPSTHTRPWIRSQEGSQSTSLHGYWVQTNFHSLVR